MTIDARKQKIAEDRAAVVKARETATAKLRNTVDAVLRTDAGKELFRHLHDYSGFARPDVMVNPVTGEVNPLTSVYNGALRLVYLHLRALADPALLLPVEFPGVNSGLISETK